MDCFALEHNLTSASARVVAGQSAVLAQRLQIRELERCGFDASLARALLRDYEQSQAMAVFDRNRFASALATSSIDGPQPVNDDDREHFIDIDTCHRQAA